MKTRLPLLLEPGELARHLGDPDLLIVDLSRQQVYEQAHVPGAIHLDFRHLQDGGHPAPGLPPAPEVLSDLFSAIGLTPEKHVVACDDEGGGWAARLLWLLELVGHEHYSLLDGGIHAWLAEDLPVDAEPVQPHPSQYRVEQLRAEPTADMQQVLSRHQDEDVVIWDARSEEEYAGVRAFAQKGGHIPGAVHYEWTEVMDRERNLRLRPLEDIRRELEKRGITPDKEVITHCQTHHRSSLTWLVGRILGFERIRGYPGSWAEWGNHPDTPVEKEDVS